MFTRISYSWQLMQASWRVLRADKGLILFPLGSGICCLMVMLSFAWPLYHWHPVTVQTQADKANNVIFYVLTFLFYFVNYFVITFFNTGIIACAIMRMSGGNPTVGDGFREAFKRLHLIVGWALVSATIGLLLRLVAERFEKVGPIISSVLGGVWSLVTFMVVPVLVMENLGPTAAIKRSASMLKQTWGENLVAGFSFGAIFGLLAIPAFIIFVLGIYTMAGAQMLSVGIGLIAMGVVYLLVLSLIHSALNSIFQAAMYMYAQNALLPEDASAGISQGRGFPIQLVRGALSTKM